MEFLSAHGVNMNGDSMAGIKVYQDESYCTPGTSLEHIYFPIRVVQVMHW